MEQRRIMKAEIKKQLDTIVKKKFKVTNLEYSLDIPERSEFGDYSSNVAFSLGKKLGKNPKEIAETLVSELIKIRDFSRVEVAGGGFVNFFVEPKILEKSVEEILKAKKNYGKGNPSSRKATKDGFSSKNRKVMVEFLSANPTGPMTLGNGRGGFSGDTLAEILEMAGYDTHREYYINDAGNQVKNILTKSVKKQLGVEVQEKEGEEIYQGEYIEYVAGKIKKKKGIGWVEKGKSEVGVLAADIILSDFIKKDCRKFGIRYDVWFSEESLFKRKLGVACE